MQSKQAIAKKNKNLHRRTQSSTVYDMTRLLNVSPNARNEKLQEMVNTYNIINSERTQRAVEASNTAAADKHIIVEDIEEVPKASGYIVPRYPNNDSNPVSIIKRRNLSYSEGAKVNYPPKQVIKNIDPELVGTLTGLNVIYERHHSIESSDFKSDKLSVSSKETHTRKSSLSDGLFGGQFSSKNYSGKKAQFPSEIETKCSPRVSSSIAITPSPKSGAPSQKNKPGQADIQENVSNVKSKLNIHKKISPEEAKNFLKLLNKQKQYPSLNSSNTLEQPGTPSVESVQINTSGNINTEEDKNLTTIAMKISKTEHGKASPKVFVFDDVVRTSGSKPKTKITIDGGFSNRQTPKSVKLIQPQEVSDTAELLTVLKSLQEEIICIRQNQKEMTKQLEFVTEVATSLQKENAQWRYFFEAQFGSQKMFSSQESLSTNTNTHRKRTLIPDYEDQKFIYAVGNDHSTTDSQINESSNPNTNEKSHKF